MKSFFDKLTGTVDVEQEPENFTNLKVNDESQQDEKSSTWEEEENEGELSVDVYDDKDQIVVKTMVAGVRPEDLDISITRDMVIIKGVRSEEKEISKNDYYHQELYWGSFTRTIMLPTEIDIEESKATEKYGLLILELPKIDKERKTKLIVK
ncbi:MAG: Hsp20/alpha crystallin family protein [Patescibacteria group bacterium]|nr:Hsp20/alpha crystallin family protein [Patescibacteria group bacterium]